MVRLLGSFILVFVFTACGGHGDDGGRGAALAAQQAADNGIFVAQLALTDYQDAKSLNDFCSKMAYHPSYHGIDFRQPVNAQQRYTVYGDAIQIIGNQVYRYTNGTGDTMAKQALGTLGADKSFSESPTYYNFAQHGQVYNQLENGQFIQAPDEKDSFTYSRTRDWFTKAYTKVPKKDANAYLDAAIRCGQRGLYTPDYKTKSRTVYDGL